MAEFAVDATECYAGGPSALTVKWATPDALEAATGKPAGGVFDSADPRAVYLAADLRDPRQVVAAAIHEATHAAQHANGLPLDEEPAERVTTVWAEPVFRAGAKAEWRVDRRRFIPSLGGKAYLEVGGTLFPEGLEPPAALAVAAGAHLIVPPSKIHRVARNAT